MLHLLEGLPAFLRALAGAKRETLCSGAGSSKGWERGQSLWKAGLKYDLGPPSEHLAGTLGSYRMYSPFTISQGRVTPTARLLSKVASLE
jgi:hypothetical protein